MVVPNDAGCNNFNGNKYIRIASKRLWSRIKIFTTHAEFGIGNNFYWADFCVYGFSYPKHKVFLGKWGKHIILFMGLMVWEPYLLHAILNEADSWILCNRVLRRWLWRNGYETIINLMNRSHRCSNSDGFIPLKYEKQNEYLRRHHALMWILECQLLYDNSTSGIRGGENPDKLFNEVVTKLSYVFL